MSMSFERERRERRYRRRRIKHLISLAAWCLLLIAWIVLFMAYVRADAYSGPEDMGCRELTEPAETSSTEVIGEDPDEDARIEAALLESGYFSDKVPLSYELQDIARTACEEYGVPYALALAVIERESRFDSEAISSDGCDHGLMQIRYTNFDWLRESTGADPTEPEGNLVCGIYMLGDLLTAYSDGSTAGLHRALMAYNNGPTGARKLWEAGTYSTDYSSSVASALEAWEARVNG